MVGDNPEEANYRAEYRTYKEDSLGNTDVGDTTCEFKAPNDKKALEIAKQCISDLEKGLQVDSVSLMNLLRYIKIP